MVEQATENRRVPSSNLGPGITFQTSPVSFPDYDLDQDRNYNNADSFAMSFDETWKSLKSESNQQQLTKAEKIKLVLEQIQNHPFAKKDPEKANQIATFRVKLLNLT